jgi:hypothetical protein
MFRALLAHPQEVLRKRHLVYCMRVMSVVCYQGWSKTPLRGLVPLQPWCSQLTSHARNIPTAACVAPPEDEQVMIETCRGP